MLIKSSGLVSEMGFVCWTVGAASKVMFMLCCELEFGKTPSEMSERLIMTCTIGDFQQATRGLTSSAEKSWMTTSLLAQRVGGGSNSNIFFSSFPFSLCSPTLDAWRKHQKFSILILIKQQNKIRLKEDRIYGPDGPKSASGNQSKWLQNL